MLGISGTPAKLGRSVNMNSSKCLLCVRSSSKHFIYITSIPHSNLIRQVLLLSPLEVLTDTGGEEARELGSQNFEAPQTSIYISILTIRNSHVTV